MCERPHFVCACLRSLDVLRACVSEGLTKAQPSDPLAPMAKFAAMEANIGTMGAMLGANRRVAAR